LIEDFWKKSGEEILTASEFSDLNAPISSIPILVEIGPVLETRLLDSMRLSSMIGSAHIDSKRKEYRFPIHINSFVSPRDEYVPLPSASDNDDLRIKIRYRPTGFSFWIFQMHLTMSMEKMEEFGFAEYDLDSLKMMATGSSPWLLITAYFVIVLHLIFEVMAVSSDISFWKERTSFEGFSSSSIIMEVITTGIILLYLRDTGETVIVQWFTMARILLDIWKLSKLVKVRVTGIWPFVTSQRHSQTPNTLDSFESKLIWRLFMAILPLIVIVSAYQLVYRQHASWWSWLIQSLALCAYTGGFVAMTPQLFRNYKLKSVEHMPWNVLFYQGINTFIDDLFSLLIRMPQMHKMSVFRDDIVFVIYHFQRWLYKKRRTVDNDGAEEPVVPKPKNE